MTIVVLLWLEEVGGGGVWETMFIFWIHAAVYLIVDPEPLQQVHVYEHPYAGL